MSTPEKIADDEQMLRSPCVDGRCLAVCFERRGDRFAHTFLMINDQKKLLLLASIEGDSQDCSPTSPPIQQLSIQPIGNGRSAALGVGMAGRNHWSISIETAAEEAALIVDVACRIHQKPERLGSSYRSVFESFTSSEASRVLLSGPGFLKVELIADSAEAAASLRVEADQLRIEPQSDIIDGQTLRWKYTLRLV